MRRTRSRYNVHERDPATRMPSGDGTAEDVHVPASMITAENGSTLQAILRQARSAHHVATGDGGSVFVLFSAPGACEADVRYHTGADVAAAASDEPAGGLGPSGGTPHHPPTIRPPTQTGHARAGLHCHCSCSE